MDLNVKKLTPIIGAEVVGIDLGTPLGDEALAKRRLRNRSAPGRRV